MANNCLVTKLNGAVDNSSLDKLGVLTLHKTSGSMGKIYINKTTSNKMYAKIIGDGYFTNEAGTSQEGKTKETNVASGSYFELYVSDGEFDIEIKNKYDIVGLDCRLSNTPTIHLDLHKLIYNNLTTLELSGSYLGGDISDIAFPNVTSINTYLNPAIYGDFRKWIESTNGSFRSLAITGDKDKLFISGDALILISQQSQLTRLLMPTGTDLSKVNGLDLLGNCSLTEISAQNCNFKGTVEGFVNNARNKATPRTTGSCTLNFGLYGFNNITYQGTALSSLGKSTIVISWTADSISVS